jgi:hypothetical protein
VPFDELGAPLFVQHVDAFTAVDLRDARQLVATHEAERDDKFHGRRFAHVQVSTGEISKVPSRSFNVVLRAWPNVNVPSPCVSARTRSEARISPQTASVAIQRSEEFSTAASSWC